MKCFLSCLILASLASSAVAETPPPCDAQTAAAVARLPPATGKPLAGWPLRPWSEDAGGPPAHGWTTRPGSYWSIDPHRMTHYWRGVGGMLWCDDPNCVICFDTVYQVDDDRPEVPIRKR